MEYSAEDEKERRQLIEQVFELQNTLDGLSSLTCWLTLVCTIKIVFKMSRFHVRLDLRIFVISF